MNGYKMWSERRLRLCRSVILEMFSVFDGVTIASIQISPYNMQLSNYIQIQK